MYIKCWETSDFKESSNYNFLNVEYKPAVVAKWFSWWREFPYFSSHYETQVQIPLGVDLWIDTLT